MTFDFMTLRLNKIASSFFLAMTFLVYLQKTPRFPLQAKSYQLTAISKQIFLVNK